MTDLEHKRIVVVGMGKSGIAAARLALERGARVTCMDQRADIGSALQPLAARGASILVGHDAAVLAAADLIVVSPGVPDFPELLAAERNAFVPVIGELELGVRERSVPAPMVAVGGTNGKSTVTTLVAKLLEAHGMSVFAGGNLGEPVSAHASDPFDALVLEVSSFQMERAPTFRPRVSILLNVTPDHLDRYPNFDAYARAKGNAFAMQEPGDFAVVPHGDAVCLTQATRGKARVVTFGPGGEVGVDAEGIRWAGGRVARDAILLRGEHNLANAAAAIAAVLPFDVGEETIREVLASFVGLAHRVAFVRELRGVRFYDDSKGTNVGASVAALAGMREPRVVLIAGGRDKGGSYGPLVETLRGKSGACVTLGEAAPLIERALEGTVPFARAASMEEAVRLAFGLAKAGDAVLLSPACSSFDMFRDYAHRGDVFAEAARNLG